MELLYISNQRLPTEKAYGIQIAKTCEAFADLGIDVTLAVPYRSSDIEGNLFDYYSVRRNFKFEKIFSLDFYLPGKLDKIAFAVKNFISATVLVIHNLFSKADIIYSRDEPIIFLFSFFKKPESLIFEAHRFSGPRRFFYRRFKNKNLRIVTISNGLRDKFVKFGFKSENVLVAPDGVDMEKFDIDKTKEECRKIVLLPQDKKIALYTGHLFKWKGPHILAAAATYLPEVLFVFVGGTEIDILDFKKKFGNEKNIKILGQKQHKEIPLFLKAADVLILPNSAKEVFSILYTSPLKLFEYMASRRPIIASDIPSIGEVLNEENSILVEPDNAEALADGIKKALGDNIFSDQISQTAFENVKKYTWRNRASGIHDYIILNLPNR